VLRYLALNCGQGEAIENFPVKLSMTESEKYSFRTFFASEYAVKENCFSIVLLDRL
jgi:hypothetical protein